MSNIFFSAGYCFSREFLCMLFSSRSQSAGYFPLKSPITPQKSNSRPIKSTKHSLSWQILICQSFLKPFETIGDKTLLGRGEELVSTFHYPESPYGRTYANVITKISRMDTLPNFLTHGSSLRGLCYDRPGESECSPRTGLLLTLTEVSTTCAVVIFRIK